MKTTPLSKSHFSRIGRQIRHAISFVAIFLVALAGCSATQSANSTPAESNSQQAENKRQASSTAATVAPQQKVTPGKQKPQNIQSQKTFKVADATTSKQASKPVAASQKAAAKPKPQKALPPLDSAARASIEPSWLPLVEKLRQDMPNIAVEEYFMGLPLYTGTTMAKKIQELHHYNFEVKPKKSIDADKKIIPEYEKSGVYTQFVTEIGMKKCSTFLSEYQQAFDIAEDRYNVPREVIASLLYVETQLGSYLGKTHAFWSLASMAASTSPDMIEEDLKVTILPEQQEWLQDKLDEKSQWAYREVKALLNHCIDNDINPREVLGSEYGAIGICQFMPTNLAAYTDDGDGDGKIDLFNPNDAIVSTARFLAVHDWEKADTIAAQRKVIMRYNISSRYGNTVLALAESLQTGVLKKAQADAPSRLDGGDPAQTDIIIRINRTPDKEAQGSEQENAEAKEPSTKSAPEKQ